MFLCIPWQDEEDFFGEASRSEETCQKLWDKWRDSAKDLETAVEEDQIVMAILIWLMYIGCRKTISGSQCTLCQSLFIVTVMYWVVEKYTYTVIIPINNGNYFQWKKERRKKERRSYPYIRRSLQLQPYWNKGGGWTCFINYTKGYRLIHMYWDSI